MTTKRRLRIYPKTLEKKTMIKLYHFTSIMRLPQILEVGILQGEVPIRPGGGFNAPWLTADPTPANQVWVASFPKNKIRITVEIAKDDPNLNRWEDLARKHKAPQYWYEALNSASVDSTANWYVYLGGISPERFERVDIMLDDLTEKEAKTLRLDKGLRFYCSGCKQYWLVAQREDKSFPPNFDRCHNGCASVKRLKGQRISRKRTEHHKEILDAHTKRIQGREKNALLINEYWNSIAAAAWEGYLNQGRGALRITPHENGSAFDSEYVTNFEVKDYNDEILALQLRNYRPELMVFFIIERDGEEYIHNVIVQPHAEETRLQPPDAYELLRRQSTS